MTSPLDNPSVRRVREALAAAGSQAQVIALDETARSAAGDKRCDTASLPGILGLAGVCGRADADVVRRTTGFAIGGVAPVAHPEPLPVAIDASLGRFTSIYAAAGHPYCVFATRLDELAALTGGAVDARVAA